MLSVGGWLRRLSQAQPDPGTSVPHPEKTNPAALPGPACHCLLCCCFNLLVITQVLIAVFYFLVALYLIPVFVHGVLYHSDQISPNTFSSKNHFDLWSLLSNHCTQAFKKGLSLHSYIVTTSSCYRNWIYPKSTQQNSDALSSFDRRVSLTNKKQKKAKHKQ